MEVGGRRIVSIFRRRRGREEGGQGWGGRRGSVADRDRWGREVGGGRIGDRIGKQGAGGGG